MSVAIFDVNARAWLGAFAGVIAVVRNVTGAIFDEVIISRKPGADYYLARRGDELRAFAFRHVQVDSFEQSPVDEPAAEIAQGRIGRGLPLFQMKDYVRVVYLQV